MIALLQRVTQAAVLVDQQPGPTSAAPAAAEGKQRVAHIGPGMLAFIAVERGDGPAQSERLLQRLFSWRMFADESGKMNLNLTQAGGGLLLVPQFTLAADTDSGNRPSFTPAAPPELGKRLFDLLVCSAGKIYPGTECGIFGADMQIQLVNDGPVTFWLQVKSGS